MAISVIRITGDPVVVPGIEAASMGAVKKGDLIQFDTDGKVALAAAGAIDGVARGDLSGTTSAACEVELIDPGDLYVGQYSSGTTQTLIGESATLSTVTGGAQRFTTGGTTATGDIVIVALDPRDALGLSGGRILFRFNALRFHGR
jgi:hypothetical protein